MAEEQATPSMAHCNNCGFDAPAGSSEWERVAHPPLGTVTMCPECGSTQIHNTG